jgi:phenylalanyl-tRNA synthetase beta subunit
VERVEVPIKQSALEPYREMLKKEFTDRPTRSVNEAREVIQKLTGMALQNDAIREFLYSLGMVYRKVGAVPSKADPEAQETFKKKSLFPAWKPQKKGKDKSSSSTQPTSSTEAFWVFSGQ